MKKTIKTIITLFITLATIISFNSWVSAADTTKSNQKYNIGSMEPTDKEYVPDGSIDKKDSHSGWTLGNFNINGYSRMTTDSKGTPVFLKNVGDEVFLSFSLEQNILKLNGDETKCIAAISEGYDKNFDFSSDCFGQGLVLVKFTDSENSSKIIPYANFLKGAKVGADTKVQVFEEGDYEVSLDYCIADGLAPFGLSKIGNHKILPSYNYYRIYFKFKIRNGNCMVFPCDVKTKSELTNCSYTENGFYLDLAKSKYLTIDIKKQLLNEGKNGLVEDTRFNRPSYDGAAFTEEGIYVITVHNTYTNQKTTKTVYVGNDNLLKAYANYSSTGITISDINKLVNEGATISEEGIISNKTVPVENYELNNNTENITTATDNSETNNPNKRNNTVVTVIIVISIVAIISILGIKIIKRKKGQSGV